MSEKNDDGKIRVSYIKENYLEYAIAVLKDRAIPYLSDGLKPVHRRVIYSMLKLRNYSTDKHKKSARVVGDVIGKYHPHGDTSVYDAMVRVSQWWSVRYPLVDGQGNMGSPDGDNPAAMRYTEVRLTKFAEELLLSELSEDVVDYKPNYDGVETEPVYLPARHNLALLNGATGIAVALSTDIPSHNIVELNEVTKMYIDNNDIDMKTMMEVLRGPDLAKGGHIIDSPETLLNMYETGHGGYRVRCKWRLEKLAKGDWRVIVYELPPNITTLKVLEIVDGIMNPKGGKDGKIAPKDVSERALLLNTMSVCRDYSDKSTPIQIILEPKSKKQDPEEFMNYLIPKLGLEERVKFNLTMVGLDGTPKQRNFKDIVADWVKSRFDLMTRRTISRLKIVNDRLEILNGRLLAFASIKQVIDIIQNSEDPKADLISMIGVNERQAEDILDIRLRQLARLEGFKIEKEMDGLNKESKGLNLLLTSEKRMFTLMKKELDEFTAVFADDRRTLIEQADVILRNTSVESPSEDITVVLTKQGWITSRKGHDFDVDGIQMKIDDDVLFIGRGNTVDNCCFFGSDGRAYSVRGADIPDGKVGWVHLNTLIQTDGKVDMQVMVFPDNETRMLFYNDEGFGYVSNSNNLYSKNKAGKNFMTLPSKESKVQKPIDLGKSKYINIQTTDDRVLVYDLVEIKELDRGKGVQLVKLIDGHTIKAVTMSEGDSFNLINSKGKSKVIKGDEHKSFVGKRARRGRVIEAGSLITD